MIEFAKHFSFSRSRQIAVSGFTLLELCLAIFIGSLLMFMVLPSLLGLVKSQRNEAVFKQFDALVQNAKKLSASEQQPYLMVWGKDGIDLRPEHPPSTTTTTNNNGAAASSPTPAPSPSATPADLHWAFPKDAKCTIVFPAALTPNPPSQWIFWPTGTCEPATITFTGTTGNWVADYDPLTVQAKTNFNEKKQPK